MRREKEAKAHALKRFLPGFQRKLGYCNAEVGGGRVGLWPVFVRAFVNFWFPLNNFSLLWPIDTKLAVWVAYLNTQREIATQVSVIKVKVTVTQKRNSVFAQKL